MRRAAMMMAGLIAVTGCAVAQPHLNRGTVVEKEYTPAHFETVKTCKKWQKGKPHTGNNCAQWNALKNEWHPECWEFEIQQQDTGKEEDICVSRVVYDNYKVGDTWHA